MIISKTPLRMSYVGGGSDIPNFYKEHGGAVLSTAIDAFVYVIIKERFEDGIRLSYSKTENVSHFSELEHPLVRNAFDLIDIKENIEIISIADIPSSGTGLGSSSSFSVGLINAMSAYKGKNPTSESLAQDACHLEIDLCRSPIGKQDQYAAAYGGLKVYVFNSDESVSISDVNIKSNVLDSLNRETICFYIGGHRSANKILAEQSNQFNLNTKIEIMKKMVSLVDDLKDELESNDISNFGEILHTNWTLKKQLVDGIANPHIDELYKRARSLGATGGKLLGAGGGGFMIFHAPKKSIRESIRKSFSQLKEVNFNIEEYGSKLITLE